MRFVALCVVLFAVAVCSRRVPPLIPEHFYGEFTEFTAPTTPAPPYVNGIPSAPFWASRGLMYYDNEYRNMIENRLDYCVNIFQNFTNMFPCIFFNVNATSYLINFNTTDMPPCCVFGQPWYPVRPDFLRKNVNSTFDGEFPWNRNNATWWINSDIAPPTGPFLWSFLKGDESPQVYSSFSFPGIEGWVQQNFFDVKYEKPSLKTWDLPEQCKIDDLPNCNFFGDIDYARVPSHWGSPRP